MDPRPHAQRTVASARDQLVDLSHRIHANPETAFAEVQASRWTAELLAGAGFAVTSGVAEMPTAFVAEYGPGPLTVAICAEYDALPGIGHACGHNVIAAAAVGAGLALAPVADALGLRIRVLGTPAEESGGGKVHLLDDGAFDGSHLAMMVHPAPWELAAMGTLAVQPFQVRYRGRSAHASMFPQRGLNAADALTVAQVAVGLLRQHIEPTDRIHGIVTDGGDAPNIVPERTAGEWYVRSATLAELGELKPRVYRCFEAGALATGCELTIDEPTPAYSEFRPDAELAARYVANAQALGRSFDDTDVDTQKMVGSTDMANISLVMPTIHPMVDVGAGDAVNHQPAFAAACATPAADRAVVDGAVAMAWTTIDAATDDALRTRLLAVDVASARR